MSWEVKYRCEYKDLYGVDWKIDVEEDNFAGAITALTASDNALRIDWDNKSDDVFDPIKSSEASLEVLVQTNFALDDIYAVQDLQFRMSVYMDDVLYWRGFINTRNYKEPYDQPPYPVTITAVCGLEFLEDYLYASSVSVTSGVETVTYYDDFRTESEIVTDILSKIGVTGFSEYINIYEDSHNSGVGDSPLYQTKINVDVFRDFYCSEVLEKILSKYDACIIHKDGEFKIYRPKELTGATVYGRTFTNAYTFTATSYTPLQYLNRTTHPSTLRQIDGGVKMITRPAGKITVYQNYKSRESWLDNFEFAPERISGNIVTTYVAEEWTKAGDNALFWPIKMFIPEEDNGIVLVNHNNYPDYSLYIYQDFGDIAAIAADEVFGLSFDYQWINEQGSAAATQSFFFKVSIEAGVNDYYLEEEAGSKTTCVWDDNATPLYIEILEDVPEGLSGWATWMRRIVSLPHAGPIRISFHCLNDAGLQIYMAIRNVRFIQTSNKVTSNTKIIAIASGDARMSTIYTYKDIDTIVESTYIVENKTGSVRINGDKLDYKYILGDVVDSDITNILEQFNGALASVTRESKEDAAATFVTDHGASYTGITVAHPGSLLTFTGTDDNDFTDDTTIVTTSGNLSGTVATTTPYAAARGQIDDVEVLSGTTGSSMDITIGAVTKRCTWNTDKATTAAGFVIAANIAAFAGIGITLALSDSFEGFTFSGAVGTANAFTTTVVEFSPTFTWSLDTIQAATDVVNRVDTITLSGTNGTADITCDEVTAEMSITETLSPTSVWNTRGGSEAKELLKIIGDEIAAQYARPKQLIQMPIIETGANPSTLNIIGNFQDDLNTYGGNNRKFVFNRGRFDTKYRRWEIDLCEIL